MALIGPEYVPAGIVVPLALQLDDVGARDAAAGEGVADAIGDAAGAGDVGAADVGAVDATAGEATGVLATAGFVLAEALDGGAAAFDDETGLHPVTLSAARLAATQTRPRRDRSVNLILITPSESASTRDCSVRALHRIAVTAR